MLRCRSLVAGIGTLVVGDRCLGARRRTRLSTLVVCCRRFGAGRARLVPGCWPPAGGTSVPWVGARNRNTGPRWPTPRCRSVRRCFEAGCPEFVLRPGPWAARARVLRSGVWCFGASLRCVVAGTGRRCSTLRCREPKASASTLLACHRCFGPGSRRRVPSESNVGGRSLACAALHQCFGSGGACVASGLWSAAAQCSEDSGGERKAKRGHPAWCQSCTGGQRGEHLRGQLSGRDHRGSEEPIRSLAPLT